MTISQICCSSHPGLLLDFIDVSNLTSSQGIRGTIPGSSLDLEPLQEKKEWELPLLFLKSDSLLQGSKMCKWLLHLASYHQQLLQHLVSFCHQQKSLCSLSCQRFHCSYGDGKIKATRFTVLILFCLQQKGETGKDDACSWIPFCWGIFLFYWPTKITDKNCLFKLIKQFH